MSTPHSKLVAKMMDMAAAQIARLFVNSQGRTAKYALIVWVDGVIQYRGNAEDDEAIGVLDQQKKALQRQVYAPGTGREFLAKVSFPVSIIDPEHGWRETRMLGEIVGRSNDGMRVSVRYRNEMGQDVTRWFEDSELTYRP